MKLQVQVCYSYSQEEFLCCEALRAWKLGGVEDCVLVVLAKIRQRRRLLVLKCWLCILSKQRTYWLNKVQLRASNEEYVNVAEDVTGDVTTSDTTLISVSASRIVVEVKVMKS